MNITDVPDEDGMAEVINEPLIWRQKGWTARIVKNEDDEGWAVVMIKAGESEPALVGPWTMGRDKKNPKPLDAAAFSTLVKTASEVLRRHEQHQYAMLHQKLTLNTSAGQIKITLDIVPDEDDPHALLGAYDSNGEMLAEVRVEAGFKLSTSSANLWVGDNFRQPG